MTTKSTKDVRVELVLLCGKLGTSNRSAVTDFNDESPEKLPSGQATAGKITHWLDGTVNAHGLQRSSWSCSMEHKCYRVTSKRVQASCQECFARRQVFAIPPANSEEKHFHLRSPAGTWTT